MFRKLFAAFLLTSFIPCYPQIAVSLNTLAPMQDSDAPVELLSSEPKEHLILPSTAEIGSGDSKKYLNLDYDWNGGSDRNISVFVRQTEDKDLLYVDKNNDNDLTNDGGPVIFPLNQNSVSFEIVSQKDADQKLKLSLFRNADLPDSVLRSEIYLTILKSNFPDFSLEGKDRSYYFAYRSALSSGTVNIDGATYPAGLFDYTSNGAFNDARDLFIVDFDKKGLNMFDQAEVFTLDDIIKIGDKNYKIAKADKCGKYVTLEETPRAPTHKYMDRINEEMRETVK